MADQPLQEETRQARFGVSAFVLEKARHLRDAGFLTQDELADFINEQFATARKRSVMSSKTIWRAENGHPIAATKALLILAALKAHGVEASLASVGWVLGNQGKRTNRE